MIFRLIASFFAVSVFMFGAAYANTITTSFNTGDGFVTGDTNPATLTNGVFSATFSGGQQQQGLDLPSYHTNPAGYLFINGLLNGVSGSNDTGLIDFNIGVTEVSFFAANRGQGAGVALNIFGVDDTTLLDTIFITQTSNQDADGAFPTTLNSLVLGALIGSIGIDLPGPAGNPPYVLAIDDFSVTAVPLPAALPLFLAGLAGLGFFRRRRFAK